LVAIVRQIYAELKINMPKLGYNNELTDIDPFTFYTIFNRGQTEITRITFANTIAKILEISTPPPTDFTGIPVTNSLNAAFYPLDLENADNIINELWKFFEAAHSFYREDTPELRAQFANLFRYTINIKGNGIAKITMGLFWAMPDLFLNLDSRNRQYIYKSGELPVEIISQLPPLEKLEKFSNDFTAEDYFAIIDTLRDYITKTNKFQNFADFSFAAWQYSEQVKKESNTGIGDEDSTRYWLYAPGHNAEKWEEFYSQGIMRIGWGETGNLKNFSRATEIAEAIHQKYKREDSAKNIRRCLNDFSKVMKIGDIIFVKKGRHEIVGKGIVDSEYYYDENAPDDYRHTRKVNWTQKGSWSHTEKMAMKTLTDITDNIGEIKYLNNLLSEENPDETENEPKKSHSPYTVDDFLTEVYLSPKEYNNIKNILDRKQNIILQGPPGVGKTFAAKRLAYSLMGEKDHERVALVQFHQSYSYEDFIEGFRPSSDDKGFKIKKGVFYEFSEKAADDPDDNPYFFIIDEINRGNLSKIFGELFMLIEKDKRDYPVRLLYFDQYFHIPKNLYIIGMMNTADRSLALLDYALRRRFSFYDMEPAFDSDGFIAYKTALSNPKFDRVVEALKQINQKITTDSNLGPGFRIGHSYLCNLDENNDIEQELQSIITYDLLPLLKEYWFDDDDSYIEAARLLREAIL
ncbi:MAG: AAA family ATPase, partial [Candidatus Saccharibacteria bacterium]|nr:AAA family ATPase [Candidatus Saccharibacteria bacterium]